MITEKDLKEFIETVSDSEDILAQETTVSLDELAEAEYARHALEINGDRKSLYNIFKEN